MAFNFEELAKDQSQEQAGEAIRSLARTSAIYYNALAGSVPLELASELTKMFNEIWLKKVLPIGPTNV